MLAKHESSDVHVRESEHKTENGKSITTRLANSFRGRLLAALIAIGGPLLPAGCSGCYTTIDLVRDISKAMEFKQFTDRLNTAVKDVQGLKAELENMGPEEMEREVLKNPARFTQRIHRINQKLDEMIGIIEQMKSTRIKLNFGVIHGSLARIGFALDFLAKGKGQELISTGRTLKESSFARLLVSFKVDPDAIIRMSDAVLLTKEKLIKLRGGVMALTDVKLERSSDNPIIGPYLSSRTEELAPNDIPDGLRVGDSGPQVDALQECLVTAGYLDKRQKSAKLEALTRQALTNLQVDFNTDGIESSADQGAGTTTPGVRMVCRQLRDRRIECSHCVTSPLLPPRLHIGDTGKKVGVLQHFLATLGYFNRAEVDDRFGPKTAKALGQFQEDEGLLYPPYRMRYKGTLDPFTAAALNDRDVWLQLMCKRGKTQYFSKTEKIRCKYGMNKEKFYSFGE